MPKILHLNIFIQMKSSCPGIINDSEATEFLFILTGSADKYVRASWSLLYRCTWGHGKRQSGQEQNQVFTCFILFNIHLFINPKHHSCYSICFCRVISCCPDPPVSLADQSAVVEAILVLKTAKRPLVIIGKGSIK